MTYSRVDEFTKAKDVLAALGLNTASLVVADMEAKANRRETVDWSDMQSFLNTFETESGRLPKYAQICKETFEVMDKIIMQALENGGVANKQELKRRAFSAPKIDRYIDSLNNGLSVLHSEVYKTRRPRTGVLLFMFGHAIRWQVIEEFAEVWVGHWAKGIKGQNLKKESVEMLLTMRAALQAPGGLMSDSRLYRNAIAHGGFKFEDDHTVSFWTCDSRGVKHDLPLLNSGDLANLYNMGEVRLRSMESIARVLRAWGRHGQA